jgi:hypothetical protein
LDRVAEKPIVLSFILSPPPVFTVVPFYIRVLQPLEGPSSWSVRPLLKIPPFLFVSVQVFSYDIVCVDFKNF